MVKEFYNEDCGEGMRNIKKNTVDLVLTDPPFGMSFQSNYRGVKHKRIEGDDNLDWLPDWMKSIDRVAKENAHLYIFCSHHNIEVFKEVVQRYRKVKNILIWEKNNTGMGDLYGDYAPKYEFILFCSNSVKKLNGGRDSNIIKARRTGNDLHPTEKPVDLMEFLIGKSSKVGDVVLDTFAGSGSTLVAAKSLDRGYIGFEIDEEHFDQAQRRLILNQGSLFT